MNLYMRRSEWVQNALLGAERLLSTSQFVLGGSTLNGSNLSIMRQSLLATLHLTLSWHDRSDPEAVNAILIRFVKRFRALDLDVSLRAFEKARGYLMLYDGDQSVALLDDMIFSDDIHSPIRGIWKSLRDGYDPLLYRHIMCFYSFLLKIPLERLDVEAATINRFVEVDEQLMLTDLTHSDLPGAKRIIERWFQSFCLSDVLQVRHGPGTTFEGVVEKETKYDILGPDSLMDLALLALGHKNDTSTYCPCKASARFAFVSWDRTARVIPVPKSWKSVRIICAETVALQYFQQGVASDMIRHVHRVIPEHVDLFDQTRNQVLARTGSMDGEYATIDLSMASDTLSWKLVEYLFIDTPIFPLLAATRSMFAALPEMEGVESRIIALNKYAPMGSALNFIVQSTVYAALIQSVVESLSPTVSGWERDLLVKFLVYGDDLIVYTLIAQRVMGLLVSCGFIVNSDKSYYSFEGAFRESCGKWYFSGDDCTPLFYRLPHITVGRVFPAVIQQRLIGAMNVAYQYGYLYLRSLYIDWWKSSIKGSLPFTEDVTDTSKVHTNYLMRNNIRYSKTLHRAEVKQLGFMAKPLSIPNHPLLGEYGLFEFLLRKEDEEAQRDRSVLDRKLNSLDWWTTRKTMRVLSHRRWTPVRTLVR